MDTYSLLRQFADSWVLLAMFGFFLGAAIWAFLPSQRGAREDASQIPFRNETPEKVCVQARDTTTGQSYGDKTKGLSNG
ncbi:Cytochrome c oxidase, cbb3-type, CcoQ subunit [Sulfitobacter noctilucicola]|uniref:Cytochrome c oxidase cbb3-type subunit 4 n=1 Tax=Sulfitobacter noctilucicola TaxID=1342301 RepID=A0A7W6MC67_9RHOB|nr:CcoQ/FixQ family Cbb3-type cytochrome c oxidase assembly chaperone [Sulfitobacter noctilucicola]KIN64194.1 Cytochrome c oxidase, cbb3-type, CcoQ subunit [Sulfitobacter noctilucicola]MBB4175547.1 cytochrome c oxidase cbb3-type subunit 4 [Sulfitobacter noctilucicola]